MAKTLALLEAEKKANSSAWHSATTQAEKDRLHQANQSLQSQIDGMSGGTSSFDGGSGKWITTPSSKPSTGGYTSGSGGSYKGSASYVGVNDAEQQKIKDQMNANSQAWHTADAATRAWLEGENQRLSGLLGGSVSFNSGAGTWSGTAGINGPTYPNQFGSLDEMREAMGYNDVSAAEQAAIDAYIKQTVGGLESQKSGINQSADEAARQAYVSYMQSQATLPQALAASGYSGGMADSQRLALETGLQNSQKDIMLNRDNALNGVDTAIQQAKLEGSIQGAQSQAQLGRDAISAYQQYIQQQNAYANQDFWTRYGYQYQGGQAALDREHQSGENQANRDWQTGESDKDRETTTQQRLHDEVINLLIGGFMPSDDQLTAAGIDKATAQSWYNYARQQAQKSGSGSTGKTGAVTPAPAPTGGISQERYNTAADRFDAGDYSSEVIETMLAAGDDPNAMAKSAGFTRDTTSLGFGPITNEYLAQLIEGGTVIALSIGGKLYYKRVGGSSGNSGNGGNYLPMADGH